MKYLRATCTSLLEASDSRSDFEVSSRIERIFLWDRTGEIMDFTLYWGLTLNSMISICA